MTSTAKTAFILTFGLCASAMAQDFCTTATSHSGEKYTTTKSYDKGEFGNGIGYEIWYDGGTNSATFYNDGSFSCSFSNSKDYLCRTGLSFNSTQTYKQIGQMYADFKLVKQNVSNVGYSYVGVYGWMSNPLVEFYIVDNWLSQYRPGDWVGDTKLGTYKIDGADYDVYTNTRYNAPSIEGDKTFTQYFSIRKTARDCGRIDINAHFKKWEELGLKMGVMYEAKILGEAGNVDGGATGTADFPYAKVYITKDGEILSSSSAAPSSSSSVAAGRAPYSGTPIALPGVIEAEEYDNGGDGVAYGGADSEKPDYAMDMRTDEQVDVVGTGKGYAVGNTQPGEWLEFTIDIQADGVYAIEASGATGVESETSDIDLDIDGENVATIGIPSMTGDDAWSTYTTVDEVKTTTLTAGKHILRITFTTGYVNLDYIKFSPVNADGSAIAKINFREHANGECMIFDMQGRLIANIRVAEGMSLNEAVASKVAKPGMYLVKQGNAFQKIAVRH